MSTRILLRTASTSPPGFFQRLNEKSLRDDLQFFFALVVVTSIIYILLPLIMGFYPENEFKIGLHQIWVLALGIFICLIQGIICGTVALLGISLVEHFFLLFVDVHLGFEKTMKSVIYALSPCILFSWVILILRVPFVSLLLLFCFSLVTYFGVLIFHGISKDRALFVTLMTSAILAILFHRWIFDLRLLL
ncbi:MULTISPECIES: YIP1 family protein [unclassified Methanoculleus]|uniref:YIP1 family protein n=1 Tax=unclassified Methanoculleus TaxID=2619537 RepID=UPI0037428AC4